MLRLALRLHWLIHLKASETLALKLWHHHLGQKNGLKTEIKKRTKFDPKGYVKVLEKHVEWSSS